MQVRVLLFIGFVLAHLVFGALAPASRALAPAFAATVYGPLFVLDAAGLPVFAAAQSGGWAAPSMLGWTLLALLWLALWWGVAVLLARLCRR